MSLVFHPIALRELDSPVKYVHPEQVPPEHVKPGDPAMDVMTDLRLTATITVSPAKSIDDALQIMIHKGVRLLLVENIKGEVMGLITSSDIQGEKPMRFSQESGLRHADILVRDIMVPINKIEVMDINDVRPAHIGDIVKTLTQAGRQHALVIEQHEEDQSILIRGMFSTSQISKQMGMPIHPSERAQTFVDLEMAIAQR